MTAREDGSRLAQLWSANSIPDQGEVMIDFSWKSSGEKIAFLRRFVSAPKLSLQLSGEDDCWIEFAEDALAGFQKKLIQAYLTSELEKQARRDTKYAVPVPAEFFDKDALLEQWERMEAEAGKGRGKLSAAAVEEFFSASVEPVLKLAIVEAWGWSDDHLTEASNLQKLEATLDGYKELLIDLDKQPKIGLIQARKALEKSGASNTMIGKRLEKKIVKLLSPKPGTSKADFANVF